MCPIAGEEPARKAAKVSTKPAPHAGSADGDGEDGPGLVQRMHAYEACELLPAELFKQFVSYARQHCHPKLTHEAKLVIKEFYLQLRQKAAMQKAVCITVCSSLFDAECSYTAEPQLHCTAEPPPLVVHAEIVLSRSTTTSNLKRNLCRLLLLLQAGGSLAEVYLSFLGEQVEEHPEICV